MKNNLHRWLVLGASIALFACDVYANDDSYRVSLSTGFNFISGDYGGTEDIEDTYIPFTVSADKGRLGYRLTVPYLSVRAPSDGRMITESGVGDIIASATVYDVLRQDDVGFTLDITGKVKFGTADVDKGLGTGETDFTVRADAFRSFGQVAVFASGGYKVRGDPDGLELENSLLASFGGIYRHDYLTRSGLVYDYRESAFAGGEAIQELTAFLSRNISTDWRAQVYALTGLNDNSPDWGGGILFKKTL